MGFFWNLMGLAGRTQGEMDTFASIFRVILFPFFAFKDGFQGYSFGKILMGLQVVNVTSNEPIGFLASFKRNVVFMIPILVLYVAFDLCKGKRLGDGWANTKVIWRKYRQKTPFVTSDIAE